jgi:hypothetical protein
MGIQARASALVFASSITVPLGWGQATALQVSSATAQAGTTVQLTITLASSGGAQPADLQWDVSTSAGITAVSTSLSQGVIAEGKSLFCNGLRCLISGMNANVMADGVLATLNITLSPSASGSITVSLKNLSASAPDGSAIAVSAQAGTIQVSPPVNVTVSPSTSVLPANQTQQFTATVTGGNQNAPISRVQYTTCSSSASSCASTFGMNNTAGNTLVAALESQGTTNQTLTVTDSSGNSYSCDNSQAQSGITAVRICYALSIRGGVNTVTCNRTSITSSLGCAIFEYAGLATSNARDQGNAAASNSSTAWWDTGAVTTTQAAELLFAAFAPQSGSPPYVAGVPANWTIATQVSNLVVADEIVSSTGVYKGTTTLNSATSGVAVLTTFRSAPPVNPGVNWSVNPVLGAITSSGAYSAPATVSKQQVIAVTATSVTDPNSSASASTTLLSLPAPTGLVGYWPFEENGGTTAADFAGANTASLANGVSWVSGEIGNAIMANGQNQYAIIPAVDLSGTNAVTVALWVNRTYSTDGGHTLFEAGSSLDNSTTGFGLFPDDQSCGGINVSLKGNVGYNGGCYNQPTSGVWHQLVAVYDKSQNKTNEVTLYIDGILQKPRQPYQSSNNSNKFGYSPIYLFSQGGTTQFTAGSIDDLQIFNRALSASEIQQLYNAAIQGH